MGFSHWQRSVNKNDKLVERVSKYMNNPYMLNENADHLSLIHI